MAGVYINDNLPIHLRNYPRVDRPRLFASDADWDLTKERLNISPDKSRGAFSWLTGENAPLLTFVGSSHITHMKTSVSDKEFAPHLLPFMINANYVACGGLKWHSAKNELHGIFNSQAQLEKYGNQWGQFDELDVSTD